MAKDNQHFRSGPLRLGASGVSRVQDEVFLFASRRIDSRRENDVPALLGAAAGEDRHSRRAEGAGEHSAASSTEARGWLWI